MASKHYIELDKTLATWVHKALESKKFKYGFTVFGIWLLNLKAIEHTTSPLDIYIARATNDNEEGEEDYNSNDEVEGN
jgi:hypothetical protein